MWTKNTVELLHGFFQWKVTRTVLLRVSVGVRRIAQDQIEGIVRERKRASIRDDLWAANGVLYSIRRDATNSLHSPARAMENIRCGGKQCQRTFQERLWILAIKSDFLEAAATVPNAVDPTFILHCNRILRKLCIQMRYVWSAVAGALCVGRFRLLRLF